MKRNPQNDIQQDALFVNLKTTKIKIYTLKKYTDVIKLCKKGVLDPGGDGDPRRAGQQENGWEGSYIMRCRTL